MSASGGDALGFEGQGERLEPELLHGGGLLLWTLHCYRMSVHWPWTKLRYGS